MATDMAGALSGSPRSPGVVAHLREAGEHAVLEGLYLAADLSTRAVRPFTQRTGSVPYTPRW